MIDRATRRAVLTPKPYIIYHPTSTLHEHHSGLHPKHLQTVITMEITKRQAQDLYERLRELPTEVK